MTADSLAYLIGVKFNSYFDLISIKCFRRNCMPILGAAGGGGAEQSCAQINVSLTEMDQVAQDLLVLLVT